MSDLISRQAVLEYIASWLKMNSYYHPYSKGESIPTSEIKDIVNSVPSVENKGEWIPVSERLPENTEYVLATDGLDMFVAWHNSEKKEWTKGWHSFDDHFDRQYPILAWQPLPKPYKAESEDK